MRRRRGLVYIYSEWCFNDSVVLGALHCSCCSDILFVVSILYRFYTV